MKFQDRIDEARDAGFTDSQIGAFVTDKRDEALRAGFSDTQIDEHLGIERFNNASLTPLVDQLHTIREVAKTGALDSNEGPEEASSIWEGFVGGLQGGVTGLATRGELPTITTPESASFMTKLASQFGQVVSDMPAIVPGILGGGVAGAAGSAAFGPAAPIAAPFTTLFGAGTGAFAFPAIIRESLISTYEQGEIQDFQDFWARFAHTSISAGKEGLVGGTGFLVGGPTGKLAQGAAAKVVSEGSAALIGATARGVTEMATFSVMGAAIEGEVPNADHFLTGSALVLGLTGIRGVRPSMRFIAKQPGVKSASENLRKIYQVNGLSPKRMIKEAQDSVVVRQETMLVAPNGKPPRPAIDAIAAPEITPEASRVNKAVKTAADLDVAAMGIGETAAKFAKDIEGTVGKVEEVPLSASQQAILSRIGTQKSPNKVLQMLQPDTVYRTVINELAPLEQLGRDVLGEARVVENDPAVWARQTYASASRAGYNVRFGTIDFKTLKETSKDSMIGAIREVVDAGGSYEGMNAYKMSKTALERQKRGIETGIDTAEATNVLSETSKVYENGYQQNQRAKDGAIQYYADSGMISKKGLETLQTENAWHAPLKRVLDPTLETSGQAGRSLKSRQAVKTAKGSKRQILDPTKTEIENMHLYYAMADRNRVMAKLVTLVEEAPEVMGEHMVKVKKPSQPIKLQDPEIKSFLKEHGLEPEDLGSLTVFRRMSKSLEKDQALYFRDGKPEVWQFKDPAIADLFRTLEAGQHEMITEVFTKFASFKRAGITGAPDFPMRATFRDLITSAVLTDSGFVNWFGGAASLLKKDAQFKTFIRNGGMGANLTSMDANYIQRDINKLFKETGVTSKIVNTVKSPVEAMQLMQEFFDNSTRNAIFEKQQRVMGRSELDAATRSRTGVLDFAQRGSSTAVQWMARTTPFLRPTMLGLEQLGRAFKERPQSTAAKGFAYITAPSIMLWMANNAADQVLPENEKYQNLPRWQRDNMFILPPINGVRIRFPKPPVIGIVFGSSMERFLDSVVADDPRAFKDFGKTAIGSLIPPLIPAVLLPIGEAWANKRQFTGAPLVPSSLEGASGYMQYAVNTSETAKKVSQFLSDDLGVGLAEVSPITLENFVQGWLGQVGLGALDALDAAVLPPSEMSNVEGLLESVPFVKSFIARQPGASAAPVRDFYDALQEFKTRAKNLSLAKRRMSVPELRFAASFPRAQIKLGKFEETIRGHVSVIVAINRSKMTDVEKRQKIDATFARTIEVANGALTLMDKIAERVE